MNNMTRINKSNSSNLRGKRWTLVVHGASEKDLNNLKNFFETDEVTCAAVAYETGKQGIHPHWQVYFETAVLCRLKERILQILGDDNFHLEVARGTKNANLKYVYAVNKQHEIGWVRYAKEAPAPSGYC